MSQYSIFNKAVQYHQSGQLQEAERIYQHILKVEADHADALHLLGLIAYQTHNYEKAESLINKAIDTSPETALYHCSLGGVYQAWGNAGEAIACYKKAIGLDPNYFEAMYNLANAFQIQNRFQEAISSYQTALKLNPQVVEAYYNLGRAYHQTQNFQEALAAYQKALEIQPAYADAFNSMGNIYQKLGRPEMAMQCYQRVLEISPNSAEAFYNTGNLHQKMGDFKRAVLNYQKSLAINAGQADTYSNLGHAYLKMERHEDAVRAMQKAIEIEPAEAEYHVNLGNAFLQQERFAEAIGHYRTALVLLPNCHDALINMGNALQKSMRFDEALASFSKALEYDPQSPMAYNNLGKAYQDQGDYETARRFYKTALEIKPGYAEAHFNHAFILLMMGEFAEGWEEYEWRFKRAEWQKTYPHSLQIPRWDGSNFAGKRLLVHCEQGYGDLLQFVRYLPLVKARGGTVIFEAMQAVQGLLENYYGIDELVVFDPGKPPNIKCDLYIPLLSLPGIFATNAKSIPAGVPYLHANPNRSRHWRKLLVGSHFKVGLVWSGKPTDPNRSCALADFHPLANVPGIYLYGLQKGSAANQTEQLPEGMEISNLGQAFEDFTDTAAVVESLDLIISIDTAVAHLAGAMGKPVWVLLPFVSDWRWHIGREDSPWYPTMKLYRQESRGDWQTVCNRIAADLWAMVESRQLPVYKSTSAETHNDNLIEDLSGHRNGDNDPCCRILSHYHDDPVAAYHQGMTAYRNGDYSLALELLEKALDQDRENSLYHYNFGLILIALERTDEAIQSFQQAVRFSPDFSEAQFNLGLALKKQGQFDAAKLRFEKVVQLKPNDAEAYYNLGNILKAQAKLEDAEKKYYQVLKLKPYHPAAFNNLGLTLKEQGRIEAAIENYQQALKLKPDFAEAHWNLSLAHLLNGNFEAGWIEYEWRFKRGKWASKPQQANDQPIWDGSGFEGLRLLVRGEQGIGDNIQFIRYLTQVKSRGGTLIFETIPALHPILKDFPGIDELSSSGMNEHLMPQFDIYAPLLSLPRIFNTKLNTIPASVPYLKAPDGEVQFWRSRITADGLRVGIVWAGRPEHENNANRSCALKCFMPLTQMEGIHLFGLQKGDAAQEATHLPPGMNFNNLGGELEDFSDTAGVIENLDLVISVDTAVAHLAGAMGKPVWVIVPHAPDWRWLMHREDSPWYPTMRLFRQKSRDDWAEVFQRLASELEKEYLSPI